MTLFEINDSIRQYLDDLYSAVDEDGTIPEGDYNALDTLIAERDTKIENIALYIKELEAEATAIKAEADKLSKRAKATQAKADRLKNYLSCNLIANGDRNFSTARCKIGFRSSTVVEVDEDTIPKMYLTEKITYAADKKAIKAELESGVDIPGATLVKKDNIQIK